MGDSLAQRGSGQVGSAEVARWVDTSWSNARLVHSVPREALAQLPASGRPIARQPFGIVFEHLDAGHTRPSQVRAFLGSVPFCYWSGVPDVTEGDVPWLPARVRRWIAPLLRVPPLRPWRITAAFAVAIGVDGAQLVLGPLGWSLADEGLDVLAMVLTIWLVGFHPLLLPTFVIEFLPVVDVLPTWTGCVGFVVALRRRRERT